MIPRKVKILESVFDKERNLILWHIRFVDTGVEQPICWPSQDLIDALGIKGDVTPDDIQFFCEQIEGKEISLLMELVSDPLAPCVSQEQWDESMQKYKENFPYDAILKVPESEIIPPSEQDSENSEDNT